MVEVEEGTSPTDFVNDSAVELYLITREEEGELTTLDADIKSVEIIDSK